MTQCENLAGGSTGSSGPTNPAEGDNAIQCRMPKCNMSFKTSRGRGVHEQRMHKNWYDEMQLHTHQSKKAPWSAEEAALLTRQEARLTIKGERFINQALVPLFPNRTLEAIKGQRRNAKHKSRVLELIQEMKLSDDVPLPASIDQNQQRSEEGTDLVNQIADLFSNLEPLKGTDFCAEHLNNICRNIRRWKAERTFEELEVYLLKVFPLPKEKGITPKRKRGEREMANPTRRLKRRAEYARTQRAWKKNPCKCLRTILDNKEGAKPPPKDIMTSFWHTVMTSKDDSSPGIGLKSNTIHDAWKPVDQWEVKKSFPELTTSPGPDGLTARQLKTIPLGILTRIFNLFLLCGRLPKHLLESRTTLIPKKSEASEPGHFRPISVASVMTRTFHKILASRLSGLVPLDNRQRAFIAADGCSENVFKLDMLLRYHRQHFKPMFMASIDIAKAFDSVTHNAIKDTLVTKGLPEDMVRYIMDTYKRSNTRLKCDGWVSEPLHPTCGVKQGDPLSPIIFNMIIDRLLKLIPSEIGVEVAGQKFNAFAFADDLVLIAQTQQGLQAMIDEASIYLSKCGLMLNTGKSFTVAIRNVPHMKKSVVDHKTRFTCLGKDLPVIKREDEWTYLGVPFSPEGRLLSKPERKLEEAIAKLTKAPLKPQQRLFALRVMVLPGLYHLLILGNTNLSRLKKIDTLVRAAIRKWLNLPHDVLSAYIHANFKDGGLSIPSMRWLMPLMRKQRLESLMKEGGTMNEYHSREIQLARRRLKDDCEEIKCSDELNRKWARDLHRSYDGSALAESSKVPQQHQWVIDGTRFLSGSDYINAIRLRINSLPTRSRTSRGRGNDRLCRAGCKEIETLSHVLQRCHRTHAARVKRHNAIAAYVKRALQKTYQQVEEEPHFQTSEGLRKPDLIAVKDRTAVIIDAQVVSEQSGLDTAHKRKVQYYKDLEPAVKEKYKIDEVVLSSVTISYRGIWSQRSASELTDRKIISKKELKILSTRALIGGLNAFWTFSKSTSTSVRNRRGIG
ncbi:unnamed protein product [Xylocopa violacea]|uniref:Reverse transcriptase domain-containing protein n=1 Tax=Xylocopa violacea TaxID=135666 RepID=A0ABP1NIK4_XYLVO